MFEAPYTLQFFMIPVVTVPKTESKHELESTERPKFSLAQEIHFGVAVAAAI